MKGAQELDPDQPAADNPEDLKEEEVGEVMEFPKVGTGRGS